MGKLQFRDLEVSEDSNDNVGEEASRKGKRVAEATAAHIRNANKNMQKRKIKREYAKTVQKAKKRGETVEKTAVQTKNVTQKVAAAVKKYPVVSGILGGLLLVIIFFASTVPACSTVATNTISALLMSSYLANDSDIDDAELKYTEWETDLRVLVDNIEVFQN